MFADKYLKKRYLLPQKGRMRAHLHYLPKRRSHALRVSLLTQIASLHGKIVALTAAPSQNKSAARKSGGCCGNRSKTMRAFIVACFAAVAIAIGAAAILDNFAQESSAVAFAEPSARV